jgi:hypothetical protein
MSNINNNIIMNNNIVDVIEEMSWTMYSNDIEDLNIHLAIMAECVDEAIDACML